MTAPPEAPRRPSPPSPHLAMLRLLETLLPAGTPVTAALMNACLGAVRAAIADHAP